MKLKKNNVSPCLSEIKDRLLCKKEINKRYKYLYKFVYLIVMLDFNVHIYSHHTQFASYETTREEHREMKALRSQRSILAWWNNALLSCECIRLYLRLSRLSRRDSPSVSAKRYSAMQRRPTGNDR